MLNQQQYHHHHQVIQQQQQQPFFEETIKRGGVKHNNNNDHDHEDLANTSKEARLDKHFQIQANSYQEEFLEYFNRERLYQLDQSQVNDPVYGLIDTYRLKQQYINQRSHHGPYPHWLPEFVAVKSLTTSQQRSLVPDLVQLQMKYLFQFHPEYIQVFGEYQTKVGSTYETEYAPKLFLTYKRATLAQEIVQRKQDQCPFDETLLWKMLYNLLRAQHFLAEREASISDIYPSEIFYENFQISVLQGGLVTDRPVSQERQGRQNQNLALSKQIARTILQAALLETNELAINEQTFTSALDGLARSGKQLLANILGQLWNVQVNVQSNDPHVRSNVVITNIYKPLEAIEKAILFMDPNMLSHIQQTLQQSRVI